MVDDWVVKEARAEFLQRQELKKNKPAGKPCWKCNSVVEPIWLDSAHNWHCGTECKPCIEKERNEKRIEKEKYMKQLTKEEWKIIDEKLSIKNQKKENRSNSGINGELRYMTFDTFKDGRAIYDYAKKYAKDFSGLSDDGLYIYGPVGSGKTHLSCAIVNYILDNSTCSVKFIKVIDLLLNARDYDTNKNEAKVINELNQFECLILDDLGTEKLSEWAIQIIYKLVDDRLLEGYSPLIVTTNFSLQELEEKIGGILGERIVSRLATMCKVIKMPDCNYRLAKKITPKLFN